MTNGSGFDFEVPVVSASGPTKRPAIEPTAFQNDDDALDVKPKPYAFSLAWKDCCISVPPPVALAPFENETSARTVNVKGSFLRLLPAFEIRLFDILRFSISTGCLLQSRGKG